ncbi:amidohydrolase [Ponticoccus sp. SC2-23]|uniref:nitrilase-related carbon-nitrogen hydrolase n=1 Tax=Alexandriicola marinus TaxID=2081710 RepID=UPI000FDC93EC|nr:nitrilase-related carbon-nitrogen hydrolase [Alexandriicola marinus]MBM1222346.1 amidohydrolase [Ponticoccus sp. SC6-9]MBM1224459.1 amidohydrolase [Ponticoccus sp. SC6-15]MBM1229761.1 amidohydrolase [Ponticoccus sp. SC6-38]MBM1233425.1 amidohydrolase [Ponticoccus sp. SC6-45]MBM1236625.1 amidohydrolase [Ponticoccus sp. SC6-49]MBM1244669.1 amidohydrolase [Ponticoccus sp. SC2-64]MBM1246949.1 amidohydrolase [Ponticoccus sp. SC6-42]MBM1251427.1 amidohydrolase [Ponticoccus sp. SC6-33]MBM12546
MTRIASLAWHCQRVSGWAEQEARLIEAIDPLKADLVLLPEYAGLDAALVGRTPPQDIASWMALASERSGDWMGQLSSVAKRTGAWVCGASLPVETPRGYVNRGFFAAPWGEVHCQDKLIPTPFERDGMGIVPGQGLSVIDTVMGRFGMLICYDSEFPILARKLVEAQCDMILVPSCTEFEAGQTRVRQSCRARAIEGQCVVVQAPLVGAVEGCDIIDMSRGRPGIFVPPDHGMPADGILAQGAANTPGHALAEVDFAAVGRVRREGQVGNVAHWPEQDRVDTNIRLLSL